MGYKGITAFFLDKLAGIVDKIKSSKEPPIKKISGSIGVCQWHQVSLVAG